MVTLPRIPPMLATPGTLPYPDQDDRWAYETKLDGQRSMVYLPGDGTVLLLSRSGADITAAYPELRALGDALGAVSAVLDGEIVALDEHGHSSFERLQSRMGLAGSPARAARLAHEIPARVMLFDALFLDGRDLVPLPWAEGRRELEALSLTGPAWSTPTALVGHGTRALEATREAGLEGLVCKRTDARNESGQDVAVYVAAEKDSLRRMFM